MKKRLRADELLTEEQLSDLCTIRLLAYKKRLYKVPEGPYAGDFRCMLLHKQHPAWKAAILNLKNELANREHVARERRKSSASS